MKPYVVCEEIIKGKGGFYTIRDPKDCNPLRFNVLGDFNTYEDAQAFIDLMRFNEQCQI